jgi:hypothetical protein
MGYVQFSSVKFSRKGVKEVHRMAVFHAEVSRNWKQYTVYFYVDTYLSLAISNGMVGGCVQSS